MIYLDVAATAKYKDADSIIVDAMTDAMKRCWQNPSGLYAANVKEEINNCRAKVSAFIGAHVNEIYFTSGASESNSMAIRGWVDDRLLDNYGMVNVITTNTEHKSVLKTVESPSLGACVRYCDVDEYGLIDFDALKRLLWLREKEPVLVSISMANNEIGSLQKVKAISDLVHQFGGVLHVDATQALPYIPIDVVGFGIDMMSASGHKISPVLKGVGFLYKRNGLNIQPLIFGTQENGLRGGTENTFGIIGLSKAIEYCDVSRERNESLCRKRDYFINLLESKFGCKLNGHNNYRLPNNINVTFPQNITGESLLYMLDTSGINISTGSVCNSSSITPSHVLKAIGLTDEESIRTVRFSLPDDIEYEDIDYVISQIDKALKIIEA